MPSAPNLRAVAASTGVSALVRTFKRAHRIGPAHQRAEIAGQFRLAHLDRALDRPCPAAPSMVMISPRLTVTPPAVISPLAMSILSDARAGDAGPAHAARHHRRVAGHAAARGQNALGRMHAVNVFRAGFGAHQDDVVVVGGELFGFVGGEDDFAGGRARRGGQAGGDLVPWARRDRAWDAAAGRAPRDRRG